MLMKQSFQVVQCCCKYLCLGAVLGWMLLMTSCAPRVQHQEVLLPEPVEPRISTQVYFYPNRGQTVAQQDRDRYECYLWAVEQSGFDPSTVQLAPHQRVIVEPLPPEGHDTALGTISGAIIGAAIGSPHHSGRGAAIGAVAGAILGAASDSARQEQTTAVQKSFDREEAKRSAAAERKALNYRRAMQACLEGRGYTVR